MGISRSLACKPNWLVRHEAMLRATPDSPRVRAGRGFGSLWIDTNKKGHSKVTYLLVLGLLCHGNLPQFGLQAKLARPARSNASRNPGLAPRPCRTRIRFSLDRYQ